MSKKKTTTAKKSTKKTKAATKPESAPVAEVAKASEVEATATATEPKTPTREKKPVAKKTRPEHVAALDLEPAADIKPVRAGSHLADVLKLTARPEGATDVPAGTHRDVSAATCDDQRADASELGHGACYLGFLFDT